MLSSIKLLKFALVCLLIHSVFTYSVSALPLGLWSGPDRREIFFRVHGRYGTDRVMRANKPWDRVCHLRRARMSLAGFVITAEQQWLEAGWKRSLEA